MKHIAQYIIFLILMAVPSVSNAQIIALDRYADSAEASYSYISKSMLQMAAKYGKTNAKDNPLVPIMDKLTGIQEITTVGKEKSNKLIREVKDIAKTGKYELLVSIDNNSAEQRFVYFKAKDHKHPVASVIIIKSVNDNTTVIGITGHIDLDDLTAIIH